KQFHTELLACHTGARNVCKGVKSTLGNECLQAQLIKSGHYEISPELIFSAHAVNVFVAVLERFNCGVLAEGGCAQDSILVDLEHCGSHYRRRTAVTKTPASH